MATTSRRADHPLSDSTLSERLREEGYRFRFFQATRILEAFSPERPRIGYDGPPRGEPVRFVVEQSLGFPASEILEIEDGEAGAPAQMTVRFLGLTGSQGVLPRSYTELVIARARRKDRTLGAFLDLFNHRAVSFFYRSWEKYRLYARHDPEATREFATYVFSLFGLGTRGLRRRLAVPDVALLFYAGLLGQRPHSVTALEGLLEDYFHGVPARVAQFTGQWLELDPSSLTQIGRLGRNTSLGVDTVIGSRVWDTQSRFRVRLGPMAYKRFCEFLPSGRSSAELLELTRFFVGQEYDFEFQLVLLAAEVPAIALGAKGPEAPRLGWSTWIKSREFARDAQDTVLDAEALRLYHERAREAVS